SSMPRIELAGLERQIGAALPAKCDKEGQSVTEAPETPDAPPPSPSRLYNWCTGAAQCVSILSTAIAEYASFLPGITGYVSWWVPTAASAVKLADRTRLNMGRLVKESLIFRELIYNFDSLLKTLRASTKGSNFNACLLNTGQEFINEMQRFYDANFA